MPGKHSATGIFHPCTKARVDCSQAVLPWVRSGTKHVVKYLCVNTSENWHSKRKWTAARTLEPLSLSPVFGTSVGGHANSVISTKTYQRSHQDHFVFLQRFMESPWIAYVTQMSHIPMKISQDENHDWLSTQVMMAFPRDNPSSQTVLESACLK